MLKRLLQKLIFGRSRALMLVMALDYFYAATIVLTLLLTLFITPSKTLLNSVPFLAELVGPLNANFSIFNLPIPGSVCLVFVGLGLSLWQREESAYWLNLGLYGIASLLLYFIPGLNRLDYDIAFVVSTMATGLLIAEPVFLHFAPKLTAHAWLVFIPVGIGAALLAANNPLHIEFYDPYLGGFSPDGKQILYSINSALYVINYDGTNERLLHSTDSRGQKRVTPQSWSPDGKHIAFFDNETIRIVNADGSNDHNLNRVITPCGNVWSMTWAPDGTQIAFIDRVGSVMVSNIDGTGQHRLAQASTPACLEWSPDGQMIMYQIDNGLKIIHPDGTNDRLLMQYGKADCIYQPVWSLDSQQIRYLKGSCNAPNDQFSAVVVNVNGNDEHFIGSGLRLPYSVQWSSDYQKLYFVTGRNNDSLPAYGQLHEAGDISVINTDGTNLHTVVSGTVFNVYALSPDGKEIAYQRPKEICVSDMNGSNEHCFAKHRFYRDD